MSCLPNATHNIAGLKNLEIILRSEADSQNLFISLYNGKNLLNLYLALNCLVVKNILLSVPEKEYPFILKLVRSFDYIEIKEPDVEPAPSKEEFLQGLRSAVEDVKLIKAGKKKGKPFQQLLDEL